MREDLDDQPPIFRYHRANNLIESRASASDASDPATCVVAACDVVFIARRSGAVTAFRTGDLRRGRVIRSRSGTRATALATDGRGRHVLVGDARGELAVCETWDVFDDGSEGGGRNRGEGERECARATHDAGVTCAALERDYGARGRGRGGFAYGDERGGVYVRLNTLLGHKTVTLSEPGGGHGAARAMAWSSRNVLAWACDAGVKLYDIGRDERVALVERPRGSPSPGSYAPRLTWNETSDNGKTLLVGWADCVQVVKCRSVDAEASSGVLTRSDSFAGGSEGESVSVSEASSTRRYVARVTSTFQTEYYVAGIQPFGEALAILAWTTASDRKSGAHPELHIVSHDNVTQSVEVIATRDDPTKLACNSYGLACAQAMLEGGNFDRYKRVGEQRWWKHGFGPSLIIHSPEDVIVASAVGAKETIDWLSKREDHIKLLDVCELAARYGHIDGSVQDIGYGVIQRSFDEGDFSKTAGLCSKLLRRDVAAWESWIEKFMLARQLAELQPYIPTEEPTLSSNAYESVLNAFLADAEHHSRFLTAVKVWPASVFSSRLLIPLVESKLGALKATQSAAASVSSVVLKEALAELYQNDGQRERALNLYLDIGRPSVLNFIVRHDLLSFVDRSKLSLLAQLDTPGAMALFVEHRDSLSPKVVITELLGQGGLSARELTYAYMTTLFASDPGCFNEYHNMLFDLHLEFDPPALMNFLKKSSAYDVARACASLVGNDDMVFERVFLLSKLGKHEEAVRALLVDAKDLSGAIKLASELDNPVDLWNVIIKISAGSPDHTATLLSHAKNLAGDPSAIALVSSVREGVAISNLKARLVDIMDENTALMRTLRTSYATETKRASDSSARRQRASSRALRRDQIHVSRKR